MEWIALAEDIAQLCDKLKLESPILIGHSMGATVMTLAEAIHHIGAMGMILIEPIFFPKDYYTLSDHIHDHPLVEKSLHRRNQWDNRKAVKDYLKTKPLFAHWKEEFLDLYVQHGTVKKERPVLELTCSPQREAELFMGSMGVDPWPLLPQVQCPVLVVEGENS